MQFMQACNNSSVLKIESLFNLFVSQSPSHCCKLWAILPLNVLLLINRSPSYCRAWWAVSKVLVSQNHAFPGSLLLSLTLTLAISGSLRLSLSGSLCHSRSFWLTLAHSGSLWLSLTHSGSLSVSLRRSLAHKVLARPATSLLRCHSLSRPGNNYLFFLVILMMITGDRSWETWCAGSRCCAHRGWCGSGRCAWSPCRVFFISLISLIIFLL